MDISAVKVLLVDDNPNMRLLMTTLLGAVGIMDMREAGSAREGLDILETWIPSVTLIDYMMPEMNGMDMTRAIRNNADPILTRVPIIIVTGHGETENIQKAAEAGANDFIVKPFTARILIGRIQRCLRDPRTIAEMVAERDRVRAGGL
ncbi:MAG: response regulator [Rhodospirillum sp.]|nr:response regulator [Rhodospirillum sp.]MCF8489103.1 response regulator [Rhodospirillum sp.]MCF8498893.1 response regulator [Rhodospirillum sp.]